MTLKGTSTVWGHSKSKTLYITIPSEVAIDSQFPFKATDIIEVIVDPKNKQVILQKRTEGKAEKHAD